MSTETTNERVMDEMDRRKNLVRNMPGFEMQNYFAALNRASRVYHENAQQLLELVTQFVSTETFVEQLQPNFQDEVIRLFHNFLASVATLRDTQRTIHHQLWPPPPKDPITKQRPPSEWERTVYTPKATKAFGAPSVKFVQDLRNYALHYELPVPRPATNISWGIDQPLLHQNWLKLEKSRLEKYTSWSGPAKNYLKTQGKWVEFLPAIEAYSAAVPPFFTWFWKAITEELNPIFSDFQRTMFEYSLWEQEEYRRRDCMSPGFASDDPASPAEARRILASARADRWRHGSRGWGTYMQDSDGQWFLVSDDPWGLPQPSRTHQRH